MNVKLQDIQKDGFVAVDLGPFPDFFMPFIRNLPYKESGMEKGTQASYKYALDPKRGGIEAQLYDWFVGGFVAHAFNDPHINSLVPYMHVGIDKSVMGDWVMPHTDLSFSGLCQMAFFIPDGEFEGREFYYGTEDEWEIFKPDGRTAFYIDTLNEKFVHGISELKTNTIVYSVGIYPVPPGGRNEQLILRDELTPKWELTSECEVNEVSVPEERSEDGPRVLQGKE